MWLRWSTRRLTKITRQTTVRVLIGALFSVMAVGKAVEPDVFAFHIDGILQRVGTSSPHPGTSVWIAVALVLWEAMLGWELSTSSKPRRAFFLAFVTIAAFSLLLAIAAVRGNLARCGCGGAFSILGEWADKPAPALVRNAVLRWLLIWGLGPNSSKLTGVRETIA